MRGFLRELLVGVVFAIAMVGVQRASGSPFWPALAIYGLGVVFVHVTQWVRG